jgi:hypothetical protein
VTQLTAFETSSRKSLQFGDSRDESANVHDRIGEPIIEEIRSAWQVAPFGDRELAAEKATADDSRIRVGESVAAPTGSDIVTDYGAVEPTVADAYRIANVLGPDEWPMRRVQQRLLGVPFGTEQTCEHYHERQEHSLARINEEKVPKDGELLAVVDEVGFEAADDTKATEELTEAEARLAATEIGLVATFAPSAGGGLADEYASPTGATGPAALAGTDEAAHLEENWATLDVPSAALTRVEQEGDDS